MTVTPQTNASLAEIARALAGADDVVVCGHTSPDGDCIGSTLALVHGLRALGKRATGIAVDPVPQSLRFLPGADELVLAKDFAGACGCFAAVDVPDLKRLGEAAAALHEAAALTVRIDHHAVPERHSEFSHTDPDAVSTTSLTWEVLGHLGVQTPKAATCCSAGLMTGSGRFTFNNTDERAFRLAAEMVACGACPSEIAASLYENERMQALQLEARAFSRMEMDAEAGWAITYLTREDFAEFDAEKADAEGVVDFIRRLGCVRALCCLREQEGKVRLSFRAKDDVNVRDVAIRFGGGGHRAAAGATVELPLEEVYAQVKVALAEACRRDA